MLINSATGKRIQVKGYASGALAALLGCTAFQAISRAVETLLQDFDSGWLALFAYPLGIPATELVA